MSKRTYIIAAIALAGCNNSIYLHDGVTDGDTFYLAPQALIDDGPVLQSWVSYSLTKSTCQLDIGTDNPARASSYGCEFSARQHLLDTWQEQLQEHPGSDDAYLDTLLSVRLAGFLDEYTVYFFGNEQWQVPVEVDVDGFQEWRRKHLRRHRPRTRLIGSWGYSEKP